MTDAPRCMTQIMRDLKLKLTELRLMLLVEVEENDPPVVLLDAALKDTEAAEEMVQETVEGVVDSIRMAIEL